MVIIFKCSPDAKRALDYTMRRGEYADYSDVINAALINFAVLTAEVDEKGSIVLPGDAAAQPRAESPLPMHVPAMHVRAAPPPAEPEPVQKRGAEPVIPAIFTRSGIVDRVPPALAPAPSDAFGPGSPVPFDRWVFGQYSKLLPAKASARAMAQLHASEPAGFRIDKISGQIAQDAAALGAFLEAHDARHGLIRDDALSTGFPEAGENGDRSRLRYANQFVAAISKSGQLAGLLVDYKLVNLTSERARRIQLTRAGWSFAALPNPVLDGIQTSPSDRLSEAERTFLIDHIARCVPAEDFAFRTVLDAIKKGVATPDLLDAAVKKLPVSKADISDAFVTTQRSGLMSRMADLGLVTRAREGARVSYVITESGSSYAARPVAA